MTRGRQDRSTARSRGRGERQAGAGQGLATVLLLVHMQVIARVADAAAEAGLSRGDHFGMRVRLPADGEAALLVLLVAVALSVFKPTGLTRYGWRRRQESGVRERSSVRDDRAAGLGVRR